MQTTLKFFSTQAELLKIISEKQIIQYNKLIEKFPNCTEEEIKAMLKDAEEKGLITTAEGLIILTSFGKEVLK